MPVYELNLITRILRRPEATVVVKRVVDFIWKHNGLVREIEFLGQHTVPARFVKHDAYQWRGMYWLITFDSPPQFPKELHFELQRDLDVLRSLPKPVFINEETIPEKVECLVEEESLPPAYRQDVKDLMENGKRPVWWRRPENKNQLPKIRQV